MRRSFDRWRLSVPPQSVHPLRSDAPWMRQGLLAAWMPGLTRGRDLTGRGLNLSPTGTVTYDRGAAVFGAAGTGLKVGNGATYTNLPPQATIGYPITMLWVGELTSAPGFYTPNLLNFPQDTSDNAFIAAIQMNGNALVPVWGMNFPDMAYGGAWPLNQQLVIIVRFERTAVSAFVDGRLLGTYTTGQPYTAPAPTSATAHISLGAFTGFSAIQNHRCRYAAIYTRAFPDDVIRGPLTHDPIAGWRLRRRFVSVLGVAADAAGGDLTGAASGSLGTFTGSAAAALALEGTASGSLGTLAGTASATLALTATASGSLGALAGAADATLALTGTATGSLGTLTGTADGALALTGTAAGALGTLSGAATGALALAATASGVLGSFTGSATGALALAATASGALGTFTGTSAATLALTGQASGALGAFTGSAAATLLDEEPGDLTGTASGSLGTFRGSAVAALALGATASGALGTLTGTATAGLALGATASGSLGTFAGAASASLALGAAASGVLGVLTGFAHATLGEAPDVVSVVLGPITLASARVLGPVTLGAARVLGPIRLHPPTNA